MSVEKFGVQRAFGQPIGSGLDPGDRLARIALMGIDDIDAAPVPKLHIDPPRRVLMISRNDEPAANGDELASQVERLLFTGGFNDTRAPGAVSPLHHTRNHARRVATGQRFGGAATTRICKADGRREMAMTCAPASTAAELTAH